MRKYFILAAVLLLAVQIVSAQQPAPDPPSDPATPDQKTPTDGDAAAPGEQPADGQPDDAENQTPAEPTDQPAEGNQKEEEKEKTWWQKISKTGALGKLFDGGAFMWPILILGIIALGVIIERYRSLQMLSTDTSLLRTQVTELLETDRIEEAMNICESEKGPVPAVLSSGIRKYLVLRRLDYDAGRIEEQVIKTMDDSGVHVVAALERHLPVLATISSVAPMLGFLGTVSGMIASFKEIRERFGEESVILLAAGGIEVALLTTCFGLIVGIPAFMAYNYFTGIVNRAVLEMEESTSELIEHVTLKLSLDEGQKDAEAAPESHGELRQASS